MPFATESGIRIVSSTDVYVGLIYKTNESGTLNSWSWEIRDTDGGLHRTTPTPTGDYRVLDGSGWDYQTSTCTLTDSSGVKYVFNCTKAVGAFVPVQTIPSQLLYVQDPNSNRITLNYVTQTSNGDSFQVLTGWTDSTGRTIPAFTYVEAGNGTPATGCPSGTSGYNWQLPGLTNPYQICMTSVAYHTNLLTTAQKAKPNTYFEATGSFRTIGALVLPNGTNWSFAYTPIVGGVPSTNPSTNYGQLTQITLPTSGTIQYQWQTTTSFCGVTPVASTAYGGVTGRTLHDPINSQTAVWTYAALAPSEAATSPLTHQTTDPLGNVTKHILTNYGYCSWFETETDSYDNNSNPLKTTSTVYQPITFVITEDGTLGALPTSKTTVLWPGQSTSSQTFTYDSGFPATDQNGDSVSVPYGKQLTETDYDFGPGSPGAVLKTVVGRPKIPVLGIYPVSSYPYVVSEAWFDGPEICTVYGRSIRFADR